MAVNVDAGISKIDLTGRKVDDLDIHTILSRKEVIPRIDGTSTDKVHVWRDFYKIDCCLINNKRFKIPRYYDRLLLRDYPDVFEIVKQKRILSAQSYRLTPDAQRDRLAVREEVKRLRAERLLRPYEAQITEFLENV